MNHSPNSQIISLPAGAVAGVDTFRATFRVYVPTGSTLTGTDRVTLIVRRNDNNAGDSNNPNIWNTLTPDRWETMTVSGTIPATQTNGAAVTGMMSIISFYDRADFHGAIQNVEALEGTAAYIDDWQMTMRTSAVLLWQLRCF